MTLFIKDLHQRAVEAGGIFVLARRMQLEKKLRLPFPSTILPMAPPPVRDSPDSRSGGARQEYAAMPVEFLGKPVSIPPLDESILNPPKSITATVDNTDDSAEQTADDPSELMAPEPELEAGVDYEQDIEMDESDEFSGKADAEVTVECPAR